MAAEYLLPSVLRICFIGILSPQDLVAAQIIHCLQTFIFHLAFQIFLSESTGLPQTSPSQQETEIPPLGICTKTKQTDSKQQKN